MDDSGTGGTVKLRMRVYQQWQGNERFFCHGYLVGGPNWKSGMGSVALLIAPTVVFLVLVAPYMAKMLSPAILVISCVLPCISLATLMMTACRDPGILPRQDPDPEWLAGRMPRTRDVQVNGHVVQVRYNDTCHFYQPPRAHHCSVNDNCIERFDHHCPWVGTTVGLRNYRTFLLFIYSTTIYIMWTFGVSLGMLFVKHKELLKAAAGEEGAGSGVWLQTLGQCPGALALMIFTFIFFWFVGGLSGFHTYLVATNQTTYENFRYNHSQVPNPYDLGIVRNCLSVWCLKIPPSKVDFRAYLEEYVPEPINVCYPYQWEWPSKRGHPTAVASHGAPAVMTARPPSAAAGSSPSRQPLTQASPARSHGPAGSDSSRETLGGAGGGPMGGALYPQQEQQLAEYPYQQLPHGDGAAVGHVRKTVFEPGQLHGPFGGAAAIAAGQNATGGGVPIGVGSATRTGLGPFSMYPPPTPPYQQQQQLGPGPLYHQQHGVVDARGGLAKQQSRTPSPGAGGGEVPGGAVQMVGQRQPSPGHRWGSETDGDFEGGMQNGTRI